MKNSHLREGKGIKFWLRCKMVCGFEVCLDVFLDVCLDVYSFLLSAVCFLLSTEVIPSSSFFVQNCIRCYYIEESYDSNNFDSSLSPYDSRPWSKVRTE